ncbi:MAG: peptide ABC transporter substrate-binding protein SapA [Enterobacteriaceae bacterium]|nr:peptide ABC transporter substrate-binding protein SapA [Enterobacteriaceae bacterium]
MRYLIYWIIFLFSASTLATEETTSETATVANAAHGNPSEDIPYIPTALKQSGFIYCVNGSLDTFNPQIATNDLTVDTLAAQLYDRLLGVDPQGSTLIPELASRWEMLDDGTTYRFYLRHNVAFQSTAWFTPTRTMNADDVIFSFRRLFDKTHYYHNINNGNYPYFDSLRLNDVVQEIRKIDQYTVEFRLNGPDASFLWHLATYYAPVLSAEYGQQLFDKHQQDQIDKAPVGTGPFMLKNYQTGQFVRLVRNDNYWKRKPIMEQVVVDIGAGSTGRSSKLLTGECDVLAYPAADQWERLKNNPDLRQKSQPGMNIAYLALNTSKPPLDKLEVRQAIAYAIDNKRLMKTIYYNTAETASSMLPKASWAHDDQIKITEYNPKKARNILNKLGLNGLELTLWVPTASQVYNPSPLKMAELIQADLAFVGINMSIHAIKGRFQESQLMDKTHDMTLTGWSTDSNDPDSFFEPLFSCAAIKSKTNLSHWCNQDFENEISQALLEQQRESRLKNYAIAQQILAEQLPALPLAYSKRVLIYRNDIKKLGLSSFGNSSFENVYRMQDANKLAEDEKGSQ